jgi:CRP-like cAMP-binding protein
MDDQSKFLQVLCSHNFLSPDSAAKLLEVGEVRRLKKKAHFVEAGNTKAFVGIVLSGLMRIYLKNDKEEEINFFLLPELALVADFETYLYGKPGEQFIQCLEDTAVLVLDKTQVNTLLRDDPHFAADLHQLMLEQLSASLYRIKSFLVLNAKDRLIALTTQRADLLQRVPLNILASFIGTTKEHVSRIRKEMTPGRNR